jgi:flagellar basal body-associated protein FliL
VVRKLTNNTGQYSLWVILMLMIVLVMLAVASLGFFSSPASA